MENRLKIGVLAGNKGQFDYFMRELYPEDRNNFVYLSPTKGSIGMRFDAVIRIGTFYEVRNHQEIYEDALMRVK